ncbi:MAG TPA: zinc ribbon domain-containing protein, partial [Mycobacterium sp.]|nr:zinc ribbon domain-containing protein [Mycobacterium sp.]
MSTPSEPAGGQPPIPATPTVVCRVCGTEVPSGAFCGFCGATLFPQPAGGPDGLRLRTYAAASGEHVLRLSVISTLFPHLAHRSREAFRLGLAGLTVLLLVLALLRWQAPLVAVCALGVPLLFQLYLQETDVYDDLPVRLLALTALLGVAI